VGGVEYSANVVATAVAYAKEFFFLFLDEDLDRLLVVPRCLIDRPQDHVHLSMIEG
jgi:hypothetical protein